MIGYHILFYFRQREIKSEMKKLLLAHPNKHDENEFVFLLNDKMTTRQLTWEGNDEFSFNGGMYDVIEKKTEGNKLTIRCLADKKETALLKKANDRWRENEKNNKALNELFQLLQTLFHHSPSEELTFNDASGNNFYTFLESLPFQIKKIPTPPPQDYKSDFISF